MTTEPTTEPTPVAETPEKKCCRYIKTDGHPCRGLAIRGQLYCFSHGRHLRNSRDTAHIHIRRLDTRADLQQLATDVARSLASGTINHNTARLLLASGRFAAAQLPPLRAASGKDAEAAQPQPETVEEIFPGPNGEDLAPEAIYYGPNGPEKRRFDLGEFLYHKIFPGNEDKPLPEEGYYPRPKKQSAEPAAELPTPVQTEAKWNDPHVSAEPDDSPNTYPDRNPDTYPDPYADTYPETYPSKEAGDWRFPPAAPSPESAPSTPHPNAIILGRVEAREAGYEGTTLGKSMRKRGFANPPVTKKVFSTTPVDGTRF